MADYATVSDARAYGYQSLTSDEGLFASLITRASRLFDGACALPDNYFAKGETSQDATARKFWGKGTDYLSLDPYLANSITEVTMPDAFTVPAYVEARPDSRPELALVGEFKLIRLYGENESRLEALGAEIDNYDVEFPREFDYLGWPSGICVTVTAKWGWDAVPSDVIEAVLEIVTAIWRGKDQAFARVVNLENSTVINDPIPARARLVAERYRRARAMFA